MNFKEVHNLQNFKRLLEKLLLVFQQRNNQRVLISVKNFICLHKKCAVALTNITLEVVSMYSIKYC